MRVCLLKRVRVRVFISTINLGGLTHWCLLVTCSGFVRVVSTDTGSRLKMSAGIGTIGTVRSKNNLIVMASYLSRSADVASMATESLTTPPPGGACRPRWLFCVCEPSNMSS